jgi:TIR domain.
VADTPNPLDDKSRTVVQVVYDLFRERSTWPTFAVLDVTLDRFHEIDAQEALKAIPQRYVRSSRLAMVLNDQDEVQLTLTGVAAADGSHDDVEMVARFVQWLARRERLHDGEGSGQRLAVTSDEAAAELGLDLTVEEGRASARRLWFLVELLPPIRSGAQSGEDQSRWQMTIGREVRQFRDLGGPDDLIRRIDEYWQRLDARSSGVFPGTSAAANSTVERKDDGGLTSSFEQERTPAAAHPAASGGSLALEWDPATTGPSVFLSYAHEDGELVERLASALRARGCHVWIDRKGMRVGDRLLDRIAGAIDEVDFLLAIVSEASVRSPWCKRELSLAMTGELAEARIKVLPTADGSVTDRKSVV